MLGGKGDLEAAFEELEEMLGPRRHAVLQRRNRLGDERDTLAVIGEEMGVSRERVRQLEKQAREALEATLEEDLQHPVNVAAILVRSRLEGLGKREDLDGQLRMLDPSGRVFEGRRDRVELLLHLAGPYTMDGPWLIREGVRESITGVLAETTEDGPLPLAEALELIGSFGVPVHRREEWLARHRAYRVFGDELHRRWGTHADRAVSALRRVGRPLDLPEILERIEAKRQDNTGHRLRQDPRVMRVTKTRWGLTEWGYDEYLPIREMLLRELDRNRGAVRASEVAERLAATFGVLRSSVVTNMRAHEFVLSDGVLRRRTSGSASRPAETPLAEAKGCFLLPTGWALRRTVTFETRRGSGQVMPDAFATLIGLERGGRAVLETPYKAIHCARPNQATLGSIKAIGDALGAVDGDHLFFVPTGHLQADVQIVRKRDFEALEGMERLALECGRPRQGKPVNQVARALDIDPASPDAPAMIWERLRRRRERDLLALIP